MDPSPHDHSVQGLHLKLRTASLIKSAQSLRDMAHELRLMLVLSDEVDTARRRDAEMREVREEVERGREEVTKAVIGLVSGRTNFEDEAMEADLQLGGHETDDPGLEHHATQYQ